MNLVKVQPLLYGNQHNKNLHIFSFEYTIGTAEVSMNLEELILYVLCKMLPFISF
jgi:hypothetical protein